MNQTGGRGMWDEEDGFYYDVLPYPMVARPVNRKRIPKSVLKLPDLDPSCMSVTRPEHGQLGFLCLDWSMSASAI